jgi:hypothetical protein
MTVIAKFTSAQNAGDLNVVVVGWFMAGTVVSVTDTSGNLYTLAGGVTYSATNENEQIYYKCGIAGAAAAVNNVTATFATNGQDPAIRILEYSGIQTSGCFDSVGGGTSSTGTAMDGSVTTSHAHDLIVGATFQLNAATAADATFRNRGNDSFGNLAEDKEVQTTGTYHATATENTSGAWVLEVAAFKGS